MLLLEAVGPLALLGVEVLGYSKTLEEAPGVFVPEDGIIANGLRTCLACLKLPGSQQLPQRLLLPEVEKMPMP